jgi:hypothetical protein
MITAADEDAVSQVPAAVWKPGTGQDGAAEDGKDVAEITDLMTRAGNWPGGLRRIARRVRPSRRHLRNLADYERKTGWKYSITWTNIPDTGMSGVPGSRHPQYIDIVHREHAVVETAGVRTAKATCWQRRCALPAPALPAPPIPAKRKETCPAPSEPVRTRARRAPPHDRHREPDGHHTRNRAHAQSVTRPQEP